MAVGICCNNYQENSMEVRGRIKVNSSNHHQRQSEETRPRTRKRRWDAILVGAAFSMAFVLLISKVSHITPCEVIDYFKIDTRTCDLSGNGNSIAGQLSNQYGLGFDIVIQYALLALELSDELMGHLQQFLQNIGLQ
jgi:hypothetical protein